MEWEEMIMQGERIGKRRVEKEGMEGVGKAEEKCSDGGEKLKDDGKRGDRRPNV